MLQSDSQLERDIRLALGQDSAIESGSIHVAVQDGVAVLTGSVPCADHKRAALVAACRVGGVWRVFESITVQPTDTAHDDSAIAARVRAILALDAAIPNEAVSVTVDQGVVTLSGQVDWPHERAAARGAAGRVAGVVRVICRIDVREPPSDAVFRDRILAALEAAVETETASLDIQIEEGVVRLSGRVPGAAHREAAARAVRQVPGVVRVDNELTES